MNIYVCRHRYIHICIPLVSEAVLLYVMEARGFHMQNMRQWIAEHQAAADERVSIE